MNSDGLLLDTAVFAYALGGEHPMKEPCMALIGACASEVFRTFASVEMVQELVHHRLRASGDRVSAAQVGRNVSAVCTLLNFDHEVLDLSLDLVEKVPTIHGRDAVHAATALVYGIERIVSPDRAFDGIPGLSRVDPREFAR